MDPSRAVWGEPAHRDDAVDVGMVLETLAPRMEHHEPADGCAKPLRIRRHLQQCLRGRLKQQVVHDALVDEGETRQRLGIVKTMWT